MKSQKVTNPTKSPHGRWYGDACDTAFGLELVGERWSLLILRELMFGPRRFSDLRASLPGLSAKVLTERLATLESHGILTHRSLVEPAPVAVYELTDWGYAVEPVIQELGRWAAASPLHDPSLPLSPASFMLSLRTMLDREAAGDMTAVVGFAIGRSHFTARLDGGAMPVERGEAETADLRFAAPAAPPLAAVFYGDVAPSAAGVDVTGDPASFLDLFTLPRPA